jgi:hypothetical protein
VRRLFLLFLFVFLILGILVLGNSNKETLALFVSKPQPSQGYANIQVEVAYVDMIGNNKLLQLRFATLTPFPPTARQQIRRVITVAVPFVDSVPMFHATLHNEVIATLLARTYLAGTMNFA